jgi:DNA polymerase I-like protein with 3'-5' exonuclease and polymerase domains
MSSIKYKTIDFDVSGFDDYDYGYVKSPYENSGSKRVLFVLDHVPQEDLKSGHLLSGVTGDLLNSLLAYTKKTYASMSHSFSWLACTYNAFKTYGRSPEFRASADELFTKRLKYIICEYKPDFVVVFGTAPMRALLSSQLSQDSKGRVRYSYWLGVPVTKKIKYRGEVHTTQVVSNISLNDIVTGSTAESNLLGYMCKCLAPIVGKTYLVDSENILSQGCVLVDTLSKFDKLLDRLAGKEYVAIDTETANLNKVTNQLLTVQFAYDETKGFLVPMSHKDSPFRPKEIKYIQSRLRAYFEGENDNGYHIYTNAKFDLTQFRSECGVRYFHNSVYDILGGDFGLDENLKFLDSVLGEYYYSLGNLSVQYGYDGYIKADFSKQHRANFHSADLTDPAVQKYTALDVVVPIAIHKQQLLRAKDSGYTGFMPMVLNEISDTIHAFSKMEHTGAGLDVDYLMYLKTDESPIQHEIQKMLEQLLQTDAAKKANKILAKRQNIPTESIFGTNHTSVSVLKLNKPEHRRVFFFEVLKLEPLAKGVSGAGKIDKQFQSTYAHIPEVAQYTALEKAKKLRNAYVNSFIAILGQSSDLQKDRRIRPDFGYLTVVTHRTGARNPNLQQVPSHSALGKHIKRLFVARPGTLYVKVDYRVHEIRGWGIISFDKAVAAVFSAAKKLRDAYRLHPTAELAKRLKTEADVHVQNAAYFFQKSMEEVDKTLRNAVKGVIFGFIYGMGLKTMASNIKQDVDFTEKLLANFAKRFPKAVLWSKTIKKFAREHFYVEAPTKIRRHLWGYLLPSSMDTASQIAAQNDRQAGNAPIQGMSSKFMMNGIRILDRITYKERLKNPDFKLYISNSVHDSLENEVGYASFIKGLAMIEWALTDGVKSIVDKRYGFKLVSDLEIDFEIGPALSDTEGWDFSVHQLDRLVIDSLLFQRNKLGHTLDVAEAYSMIFSKRALTEDAPNWMKTQIQNVGYTFTLTEKSYIREIYNSGKSKVADGEKMQSSDEKASKDLIASGNDLIDYAKELNSYAKIHAR